MLDDHGRKIRHFRIPSRVRPDNPHPPSWLRISRRRGHLLARLSAIAENFGIALFVTESDEVGGGFADYSIHSITLARAAATHRLDNALLSVFFHELGHFVLHRLGRHLPAPPRRSVRTPTQLDAALRLALRNERNADRMGRRLMETQFPTRRGAFIAGYQTRADVEWLREKLRLYFRIGLQKSRRTARKAA